MYNNINTNTTTINKLLGILIICLSICVIGIGIDIVIFNSSMQGSLGSPPVNVGLGQGSSMEPIIDSGCSIVFYDSYNGEKLSKGDIISYTNYYSNSNSNSNSNTYITHKIIHKYNSYDPNTSEYKIIQSADGESSFTYIKQSELKKVETPQSYKISQKLKGETVYITKGTGNNFTDPYLISKNDVNKVLIKKPYIELSDDKKVCNDLLSNLHNLNIKLHY